MAVTYSIVSRILNLSLFSSNIMKHTSRESLLSRSISTGFCCYDASTTLTQCIQSMCVSWPQDDERENQFTLSQERSFELYPIGITVRIWLTSRLTRPKTNPNWVSHYDYFSSFFSWNVHTHSSRVVGYELKAFFKSFLRILKRTHT